MSKLTINGKDIDLTLVRPLKMRDWAALEQLGLRDLSRATLLQLMQFLHYVLHRSRPELQLSDVEELSEREFVAALTSTRKALDDAEAALDVPFSEPHTS